jgi:hypothetical protein
MMKLFLVGLIILGAGIINVGITTHAPAAGNRAPQDNGKENGGLPMKPTTSISVPYFFVGAGMILTAVFFLFK